MIELFNEDCMDGMRRYPDNHFELAIVDPPYGIGEDGSKGVRTSPSRPNSYSRKPKYKNGKWDKNSPNKQYFDELRRVSKNQIIWGANHFISKIPYDSSCWIVWDKNNIGTDFADCELAWASFKTTVRKFFGHKFLGTYGGKECIHPTQKPVKLYEWLLTNYAKEGNKILDTHGGSMSSALACHNMGFDLTLFELDKDYFKAGKARLEEHRKQQRMF